MKRKQNRLPKQIYKVMWSYYDNIGINSGVVDIEATTKKQAEKEFYKLNRNYVVGHDKNHNPIFNPQGGYVCECVYTYKEWVEEGKPTAV